MRLVSVALQMLQLALESLPPSADSHWTGFETRRSASGESETEDKRKQEEQQT